MRLKVCHPNIYDTANRLITMQGMNNEGTHLDQLPAQYRSGHQTDAVDNENSNLCALSLTPIARQEIHTATSATFDSRPDEFALHRRYFKQLYFCDR
jgi:hypothetical protein